MKYFLLAAAITICPTKDSNMNNLLKIQEFIQEQKKPKSKDIIPLKMTQEDYYEKVRRESMDPDLPDYSNEVFTKEELAMKRAGVDCVKCDPNAEDPNMRPNGYERL